jgi:hypothetical protein
MALSRSGRGAGWRSLKDYGYLLVAVWELGLARAEFSSWQSDRIVRHLSVKSSDGSPHACNVNLERFAWALSAAARRVPWRSDCLIQALAATRWLRRHGYRSEFHLGVTSPRGRNRIGHAWVTSNGVAVSGGTGQGFRKII